MCSARSWGQRVLVDNWQPSCQPWLNQTEGWDLVFKFISLFLSDWMWIRMQIILKWEGNKFVFRLRRLITTERPTLKSKLILWTAEQKECRLLKTQLRHWIHPPRSLLYFLVTYCERRISSCFGSWSPLLVPVGLPNHSVPVIAALSNLFFSFTALTTILDHLLLV